MNLPHELELIMERLKESELHDLSDFVHERLKFFYKIQDLRSLQQFRTLDEVMFHHNGEHITGVVIRVNQRTVTVKTERGKWHVSPMYLTKIREGSTEKSSGETPQVVVPDTRLRPLSQKLNPSPCKTRGFCVFYRFLSY